MKLNLPLRAVTPALTASLFVLASCGTSTEATNSDQNPLTEALGLSSEQDFFSEDSQIEAQEVTAACMKEAGFEYVPEDLGDFDSQFEEWGTKAWAEEWGFGVSTQQFSQDTVGPNLKGHDYSEFEDQAETSPNQKIQEALSPEDQRAYEEALYGSSFTDEFDEEAEFEEPDFDDLGCMNAGFNEGSAFGFFEEFEEELEEQGSRLEADPRIAEANQTLSDCVKDKGYEFTSEQEYSETKQEELDELFPSDEPIFEAPELGEGEEGLEDEVVFDQYEKPPLTEDQKTKLGEVQTEEIATAIAAHECGLEEGDYADTIKEIGDEYLSEFVEANRAGIEEYKK